MFSPISEMIEGAIDLTWPFVLIGAIIVIPLRLIFLYQNRSEFVLYKELFYLSFVIYILTLIKIVTFEDVVNYSTNSLIPFQEILRYEFGSRLFVKNVLGNILLFMPYGMFISYFLKQKKLWLSLILITLATFMIELTQLMIGRVFDIDDIILNVIGGLIGFLIYNITIKTVGKLPIKYKKKWILNIISILLLIGIVCLL